MPALRNVRRSRRLSNQFTEGAADLGWDYEPELLHPSVEPELEPELESAPSFQLVLPSSLDSIDLPSPTLSFPPGSSHSRKRKEGHIPRPPNAFIVFRSFVWHQVKLYGTERDNRNVSRIAGGCWRTMDDLQKVPFIELAARKKIEHAKVYPNYKYTPMYRKASKDPQRRISRRDSRDEVERCSKVASLLMQGVLGDALQNAVEKFDEEAAVVEGLVTVPLPSSPPPTLEPFSARAFPVVTLLTPQPRQPLPLDKVMEKTVGTLALAPTPTSISIPQSLSIAKLATERSKKPLPRRRRSGITKKSKPSQKRIIRAPAPPQPVPQTALIKIEEAPSPALATPELSYPDTIDDFVPTVDIPPLDLDGGNQKAEDNKDEYDYSILPRSTAPAYGGTYFGVKPEAHEFVDGYMLGMFGDEFDHTLIPPMPALSYESSSSGSESGTPPVTPPIDYANFTNPFKSSSVPDTRHSFLSGLDQLFAQSLSPMTVPRPSPNLAFEEYIPEELDLSAWLNYD